MYQAGPAKIAETVNKDAKSGEEISIPQSKQFINKYFSEAKALKKFIDGSNSQIENHALSIRSLVVSVDYQKQNHLIQECLNTLFDLGLTS